jgi:hypothetical protein
MSTTATGTNGANVQRRWNGPSSTWFLLMIGTWAAFGVAAVWYPETLIDLWEWGQRLPLAAEIGLWIGTLPWMLALAVFETAWPDWARVAFIAALAVTWILFSAPRAPKSSDSRPPARPAAREITLPR